MPTLALRYDLEPSDDCIDAAAEAGHAADEANEYCALIDCQNECHRDDPDYYDFDDRND